MYLFVCISIIYANMVMQNLEFELFLPYVGRKPFVISVFYMHSYNNGS